MKFRFLTYIKLELCVEQLENNLEKVLLLPFEKPFFIPNFRNFDYSSRNQK